MFQILVQLIVSLIDLCLFPWRTTTEFFLKFANQIDQSALRGPIKDTSILYLACHWFDHGVLDPFSDVDDWFFVGEIAQEDAAY